MTKEELAVEARRVRESEAVVAALDNLRTDALDALATANPFDAEKIAVHQATVRTVSDFLGQLDAMIRNGEEKKQFGIV